MGSVSLSKRGGRWVSFSYIMRHLGSFSRGKSSASLALIAFCTFAVFFFSFIISLSSHTEINQVLKALKLEDVLFQLLSVGRYLREVLTTPTIKRI